VTLPPYDYCAGIPCARLCSDDCGWSFARDRCVAGLVTEPFELNEGDCGARGATAGTQPVAVTAASVVVEAEKKDHTVTIIIASCVMACLLGLALSVLAVYCCNCNLSVGGEDRQMGGSKKTLFDNPVYEPYGASSI